MKLKDYIKRNCDKKFVIRLKDMKIFFSDKKAIKKRIKQNPLIYSVLRKIEKGTEYSITIIESGKIGKEHFMTRGHYHLKPYPEIYILIKGKGLVLTQNKKCKAIKLKLGEAIYIKGKYAHRTINLGKTKLEFITITNKTKHLFKKIEKKGFRKKF